MESFGLDKYIDEHLHSTNYLQNHVEGLEVQTKDKNWIKVKPTQDSFTVMIGDSLYVSHLFILPSNTESIPEKARSTQMF